MSKNRKPVKKGGPLVTLIALIAGGLVLLAAAVFLMGGQNSGGTPAVAVDSEKIEFGEVKLDTSLTFQVKVTNTGDGVLKFKEAPYIEIVEGC